MWGKVGPNLKKDEDIISSQNIVICQAFHNPPPAVPSNLQAPDTGRLNLASLVNQVRQRDEVPDTALEAGGSSHCIATHGSRY